MQRTVYGIPSAIYSRKDMLGPRLTSLSPARLVGLLAVSQVLVWTLAPTLTHSSPPLDVVESYMWGREWVIATYIRPCRVGFWRQATS